MKAGYEVSIPFGNHARYDFLADINGNIIRVQVKTCVSTDDFLEFQCRNSHYKNGHHIHSTYSDQEIDYFATYYKEKCYLVPISECSTQKRLRFVPPKNGQIKGVSFAKDYEMEEVLKR